MMPVSMATAFYLFYFQDAEENDPYLMTLYDLKPIEV